MTLAQGSAEPSLYPSGVTSDPDTPSRRYPDTPFNQHKSARGYANLLTSVVHRARVASFERVG
jgi:hypothetical protein